MSESNSILTQRRLKEVIHYDPESGDLTWVNPPPRGQAVGYMTNRGYIKVGIDGRVYLAHRLIWLYLHGAWPTGLIDHINGDKRDNREVNLRDVTPLENAQNVHVISKSNTSGAPGVSWAKGKWVAVIKVAKESVYLGRFTDKKEAGEAYLNAKREMHAWSPN